MMGLREALQSRRKYRSIQVMITVNFAILIFFIVLVMGVVTYAITSGVVKDTSAEYVGQLVDQVNRNIHYYLQDVEVIKHNIVYNNDIQNYLKYPDMRETEKGDIEHYLNNFVTAKSDIVNIFILAKDGDYIINNADLALNEHIDWKQEEWYRAALENDGLMVSTSRVENLIKGQYKWVISCSSQLRDPVTNKILGVLLINLNYNRIEDMCSDIQLGNSGYVFIMDKKGDLIYHPKQQLIYSNLYSEPIDTLRSMKEKKAILTDGGEQKQYAISVIEEVQWRVIGTVDVDQLLAYKSTLQQYALISAIAAFGIAILLAIIISRQILHPLKDLAEGMTLLKAGEFSIQVPVHSNNEIAELSRTFNSMARQINQLIKKINHEERQKRKNELKALQAQINPHFLYNTLDAIIWMAELKDYQSVKLMTSALAKLFRLSISKGKQFIPIASEIEHVKNYLQIQKMRYGDKLQYEIHIPDTLTEYITLKLLLQPIVENAIYHGIKYKEGTGHITITLGDRGESLCFTIEDDGIGMTEEEVGNLLAHQKDSGVGMRNVDDRVKLYFGADYGIDIDSEIDEGTTVTITIPKMTMEEGRERIEAS